MRDVRVTTGQGKFGQKIEVSGHVLVADEDVAARGDDTGPGPHELLLSALGACTSMTVKMYADRKGWPLRAVDVCLHGESAPTGFRILRTFRLEGDLAEDQRARLVEIAEKCPVARTLEGEIAIETTLD
jgi:putative redox protein